MFFSKKAHKKLANYVAAIPTTSNELSDEEYKLKITTHVTLFSIDNIDLNYDVFVEAFRKYAYFNFDVEKVGNYVESQIF